MGADLYYGAGRVHFHDNYPCGALWAVGLSWGRDVFRLLDSERRLHPDAASVLATQIAACDVPSAKTLARRARRVASGNISFGSGGPAAWRKHLVARKDELVQYLRAAVVANESIDCSL